MKNKDLRLEYRVYNVNPVGRPSEFTFRHAADTEAECDAWIESHTPADLMGDTTYVVLKTWTTSRKK